MIENAQHSQTAALKSNALTRHSFAGKRFVETATPAALKRVVDAKDDADVLVCELEAAWARNTADPLAEFKIAGLAAKRELLDAEGGVISDAEAAKRLGITCKALEKRRQAKKVIGLALGSSFVYPVWQFEPRVARYIGRVLAALSADIGEWDFLIFFLEPNLYSGDISPLDALRAGKLRDALRAASSYGEQGAA